MLSRPVDSEQIIERVAALDIGNAELMCCVRVPARRARVIAGQTTLWWSY
jgi:transposase